MLIANFIVLYIASNTGDANIVEGSACDDRMDKSSKFFFLSQKLFNEIKLIKIEFI